MPDMPGMDEEVDVAMDMPVVVAMDIVVDMSDMSILAIQLVNRGEEKLCYKKETEKRLF